MWNSECVVHHTVKSNTLPSLQNHTIQVLRVRINDTKQSNSTPNQSQMKNTTYDGTLKSSVEVTREGSGMMFDTFVAHSRIQFCVKHIEH